MGLMGPELDLLELGERVAKCLKGENQAPNRDQIVAGRAYRGRIQKLRERRTYIWGPRPKAWWLRDTATR
jgi:hypothetical protein